MEMVFKYDLNKTCQVLIQEKMDNLGIDYTYSGLAEVTLNEDISPELKTSLKKELERYGIHLIDDKKENLVQKIKNILIENTYLDENDLINKTSIHLSEKLNLSYNYLSNVFTEVTMTTIANFIILQKIERAKILLIKEELSVSEVAYKLNYSHVAHLSSQFKKKTGLTPSAFQRILQKRKEIKNSENG
jgi:AraC-like DNA-binding protein